VSVNGFTNAFERREEWLVDAAKIDFRWGVQIPLRDGVTLNATLYLPKNQSAPAPCILTLTPYGVDTYHDQGVHFAADGYPFAIIDVRGRGNSQGEFRPHIQEAKDGYDVVEWLAVQPYCNGKVATWGGSYAGHNQWTTATEFPPHLTTIVPTAAPYIGVDVPMRNNIFTTEAMQYLTLVGGQTTQWTIYQDKEFWAAQSRRWYESGRPFRDFDSMLGNPSSTFQEYLSHPEMDAHWDAYNPTPRQYAALQLPILTITGSYDDDQPGALAHYREYMKNASAAGRARHYLIIGPWDHAGTRTPKLEVGGLRFGAASLLDLKRLHLDWYTWTMKSGPRPAFLKNCVAYYLMGAEAWCYADSLEAITKSVEPYFLHSSNNPLDVLHSGMLSSMPPSGGGPDQYVYDPRDISGATLESVLDSTSLVDQRLIYASVGKQLIYHTEPLKKDTRISGFFKLTAWLSINQLDTDFRVAIYEVLCDGSNILLTTDRMRARYRHSAREVKLVRTTEPLRYDFEQFTFVAREIATNSRLRLVIGPINSIYSEKNFNSGGVVADESMKDSKRVTVSLFHDSSHPSVLHVPFGAD
jgi:putative CocE/NonD family hydrolase